MCLEHIGFMIIWVLPTKWLIHLLARWHLLWVLEKLLRVLLGLNIGSWATSERQSGTGIYLRLWLYLAIVRTPSSLLFILKFKGLQVWLARRLACRWRLWLYPERRLRFLQLMCPLLSLPLLQLSVLDISLNLFCDLVPINLVILIASLRSHLSHFKGVIVHSKSNSYALVAFVAVIILWTFLPQRRGLLAVDVLNSSWNIIAECSEGFSVCRWPWTVRQSILACFILSLGGLGAHAIFQSLLIPLFHVKPWTSSIWTPFLLLAELRERRPHGEDFIRCSCSWCWTSKRPAGSLCRLPVFLRVRGLLVASICIVHLNILNLK